MRGRAVEIGTNCPDGDRNRLLGPPRSRRTLTAAFLAIIIPTRNKKAEVAELADALDSKSSVPQRRVGSSPTFGTL
jgi:hypothetical protein